MHSIHTFVRGRQIWFWCLVAKTRENHNQTILSVITEKQKKNIGV